MYSSSAWCKLAISTGINKEVPVLYVEIMSLLFYWQQDDLPHEDA
jgi:hypothetical protein